MVYGQISQHLNLYLLGLQNIYAGFSLKSHYGGIAYHHVSDTYIALFTHFINCGVWKAVYILDGLLKNTSDIQPDTLHADTQGHLSGFQRIRSSRSDDISVGVYFRPWFTPRDYCLY